MLRSASDVGLLVRDKRVERGWTQAELARRVGVGRESLNALERGRSSPQLRVVLDLLAQFDLALDAVPLQRGTAADALAEALRRRTETGSHPSRTGSPR